MTAEAETTGADDSPIASHSIAFIEMAFRTDRQGAIIQADGHGKKAGDCGDTIEFFILLEGDKIKTVRFRVDGCINTNACANTVASMTEGKPLEAAWNITPEIVADYLQTLPPDHFHCAELAVGAFYLTLSDCRNTRKKPWQKLYR